jgi:CRP-like cAMP-binding protein
VCVLIDPSLTLTEASSSGEDRASSAGQLSGQAVDVKKLVQVCLLGAGAVIGDMLTLHEASGSPPHRSATVVALTELLTFKVPLREFLRRMPADVLEVRGLGGLGAAADTNHVRAAHSLPLPASMADHVSG